MIRPFKPEDAPSAAELLDQLDEGFETAESLLHHVESMPARAEARFWVALDGEAVVGWAEARRKWSGDPSIGKFRAVVRRDARGRGLGNALWERALEHLAALEVRRLVTYDDGTEEAARFITKRGFEPGRRTIISILRPEPIEVDPPDDARILPLTAVSDRKEELFRLYQAGEEDLPSYDVQGRMTLDEWLRETLDHPLLDREGSVVVEVEGRLASLTFLLVDRGRSKAENEMTATLPELRGRGLATLAKRAATAWAAANGVREMWTGNDEDNTSMLAINRRLGYRPVKTLTDYFHEAGKVGDAGRAEPAP